MLPAAASFSIVTYNASRSAASVAVTPPGSNETRAERSDCTRPSTATAASRPGGWRIGADLMYARYPITCHSATHFGQDLPKDPGTDQRHRCDTAKRRVAGEGGPGPDRGLWRGGPRVDPAPGAPTRSAQTVAAL